MDLYAKPIHVGHLEIGNRLVMPPMATAKAAEDGTVTEALCQYYAERARGRASD